MKKFYCPHWISPILLGLLGFFIIAGPNILISTNIAWLEHGDPATYFLGWDFFRYTPWSLPLSLNPSYGLELSNSIVYSDSNVLLALIFKSISSILPQPFQYFGLWILICLVLQAWFGWKLIGLMTDDKGLQLIGAAFFLFSPAMLWRLHPHILHINLVAHFLILWALYLIFSPKLDHRWRWWCLLISLAILIHGYLMAMVLALFYADLLGRKKHREITHNQYQATCLCIFIIALLILWLAGYFSSGRYIAAIGFGSDPLNLLSIIDSGKNEYGLWSNLIPDLPGDESGHESFNYLGLGIILLICLVIPFCVINPKEAIKAIKEKPHFFIVILLLSIFAISNNIRVGSYELTIPLPTIIENAAGIFRASARMFWPAFYLIYFFTLYGIIKYYPNRLAKIILLLALLIQLVDTNGGREVIRRNLMTTPSSTWKTSMISPFWKDAAMHYKKVRWIRPGQYHEAWQQIAYYSSLNHLGTDSVYLARTNLDKLNMVDMSLNQSINTGSYDFETLYIIEDSMVDQVREHLDIQMHLLQKIDGFNVLAPKWHGKSSGSN